MPQTNDQLLDITRGFKDEIIDTPGVIEEVSTLFANSPNLAQGFQRFLPPGYQMPSYMN